MSTVGNELRAEISEVHAGLAKFAQSLTHLRDFY